MQGEITPAGLICLDSIFDNRRDSVKMIRQQVKQYEKAVFEEAKRLEKAWLKEQKAERLKKEAEKLKQVKKFLKQCVFISWDLLYLLNYFLTTLKSPIMELNRIREVLDEKGIKQTWLAEKLGKSFNMVNAYVCNRKQPSLEVLHQISEILQVDMKELIFEKRK